MKKEITIYSLTDLDKFAKIFASKLRPGQVIALYGELGTGKTSFVKRLVAELAPSDAVTSPTFQIMNIYQAENGQIYHFDLYRIKQESELENLGFSEFLDDPQSLVFIEWPEIAESLLPSNTMKLRFQILDETTREIIIGN